MQSCKLGGDEFDKHDIFSSPINEEVIKENAIGICSLDENMIEINMMIFIIQVMKMTHLMKILLFMGTLCP